MQDYNGDYSVMGQKGSFADYGPGWAAVANTPGGYYKTFATEGGLRVPFIVSYPKALENGKITNEFGFVKDLVPTILETANVDANGTTYDGKEVYPITGVSMWNFLKGSSDKIHDENEMIGYELAGGSAVFQGDYKLVRNIQPKGTGKWELYDIIADPTELNNLADKMPELVETLKKGYLEYEQQNGVIPVPEDYDMIKQGIKNSTRVHPH
jgi:arylsulfatase